MIRTILWVGGGVAGVAIVLFLSLMLSLRTGYSPAVTAVRRFNRRFTNKLVMKTAGRPDASASVIRHVGRRSGMTYETPVGLIESDEGFDVVLPYGTSADWVKNVMTAGTAVAVHQGKTFQLFDPQVVSADQVVMQPSFWDGLGQRLAGVGLVLRLKAADGEAGGKVVIEPGRKET